MSTYSVSVLGEQKNNTLCFATMALHLPLFGYTEFLITNRLSLIAPLSSSAVDYEPQREFTQIKKTIFIRDFFVLSTKIVTFVY